jgi:Polyketide cyclase / dehydrase and lipid transport
MSYTTVTRSLTIPADTATVLGMLTDFHRWTEWSPWEGIDPNMERTYSGSERGEGAGYAWSGNKKAGKGSMLITRVGETEADIDLEFIKPFKSSSKIEFRLEPVADGTALTWNMLSPNTAMSRVMGVFFNLEKLVGPDLEKGLAQLAEAVKN